MSSTIGRPGASHTGWQSPYRLAPFQRETQRGAVGVLVADLPAPNNPCPQWIEYGATSRRGRGRGGDDGIGDGDGGNAAANGTESQVLLSRVRGGPPPRPASPYADDGAPDALRPLLTLPLAKYDAYFPAIDSGVLAVRDSLLARSATVLVTEQNSGRRGAVSRRGRGDTCGQCFRCNSGFVRGVLDARVAAGKQSFRNWFKLGQLGPVRELAAATVLETGRTVGSRGDQRGRRGRRPPESGL